MNKSLEMIGDYVRHLEEENAILKKRNKELEDGFKSTTDELCEYATKIDEAIEYIKWQYENPTYDNVWRKYEVEKLLEILGDKE